MRNNKKMKDKEKKRKKKGGVNIYFLIIKSQDGVNITWN
jgi:hypothetical protein